MKKKQKRSAKEKRELKCQIAGMNETFSLEGYDIRRRLEFEKTVSVISSRFVGIFDTDKAGGDNGNSFFEFQPAPGIMSFKTECFIHAGNLALKSSFLFFGPLLFFLHPLYFLRLEEHFP